MDHLCFVQPIKMLTKLHNRQLGGIHTEGISCTQSYTAPHLLVEDKVHSICVGGKDVVLERDWSAICVYHMTRLWQVCVWSE